MEHRNGMTWHRRWTYTPQRLTADQIRLILRLARGDAVGIARCLDTRAAALAHLAEDALTEGLALVLLRALANLPPGVEASLGNLEALHSRKRRQEKRSAVLLDALVGLADRFAAAGQVFIMLKGPYLAARFYGDVTAREFVDLDLLVPSGDRWRASRLLEAAGYRRRSRVLGGEAITSFFVHGFDFVAGEVNLDLHWRLSRHPSLRVDEARIWARRRAYSLGGKTYAVLSDEHELVFGALSLLRDIERGRPKAKHVVNLIQVAAAIDAELDWDAVLERGLGEGTRRPMVNVLSLCLDVADAHDLAPRFSSTLRATPAGCATALRVIHSASRPIRWGLGNKWWSARAHDTTPLAWLLSWAASLPFRTAVHRRPIRPPSTHGVEGRP